MNDTPKGWGFASNPDGKRRSRRIGDQAERYHHGWITGARRDGGAAGAGKEQRVEAIGGHDSIDAVGCGKTNVFRAVGFIAGAVALHVHLVRDVEVCLAVLECSGLLVLDVPSRGVRSAS